MQAAPSSDKLILKRGDGMDNEMIAVKLQEVADRSIRNEGRIKKLENEHEVLHELATSVAVMANTITSARTMASPFFIVVLFINLLIAT